MKVKDVFNRLSVEVDFSNWIVSLKCAVPEVGGEGALVSRIQDLFLGKFGNAVIFFQQSSFKTVPFECDKILWWRDVSFIKTFKLEARVSAVLKDVKKTLDGEFSVSYDNGLLCYDLHSLRFVCREIQGNKEANKSRKEVRPCIGKVDKIKSWVFPWLKVSFVRVNYPIPINVEAVLQGAQTQVRSQISLGSSLYSFSETAFADLYLGKGENFDVMANIHLPITSKRTFSVDLFLNYFWKSFKGLDVVIPAIHIDFNDIANFFISVEGRYKLEFHNSKDWQVSATQADFRGLFKTLNLEGISIDKNISLKGSLPLGKVWSVGKAIVDFEWIISDCLENLQKIKPIDPVLSSDLKRIFSGLLESKKVGDTVTVGLLEDELRDRFLDDGDSIARTFLQSRTNFNILNDCKKYYELICAYESVFKALVSKKKLLEIDEISKEKMTYLQKSLKEFQEVKAKIEVVFQVLEKYLLNPVVTAGLQEFFESSAKQEQLQESNTYDGVRDSQEHRA